MVTTIYKRSDDRAFRRRHKIGRGRAMVRGLGRLFR
jgi:hypothetical protein